MRIVILIVLAALAIVVWASPARGDTTATEPVRFQGRHLVALNVGAVTDMVSNASVNAGDGVSIEAEGSGMMAAVRYAWWFEEFLALDVSVGVVDADASVAVQGAETRTQAATVTRVMMGLRYQPPELAMGRNARPYVVGRVGPYAGHASGVRTGIAVVEIGSHSDTALGLHVGVGLDVLVWSRFDFGAEAGYGLVGDFDRAIGPETNYSSPEFLISLGVSFGGIR
jgi:hypothetical protein